MKVDDSNAPAIQPIDQSSIHHICSGQVILDLATAVKELVENSLDANGKIIEIRLKEYGKEYIEVSDNGDGIEENDFESLCLKHYTSKLKEFSDLTFVSTFGFRGEALSSLSALADVVVSTHSKTSNVGYKLEFDHSGKLVKNTSVARATGTTVTVSNLFYTLPVRYKEFHFNIKKEFSKLIQVLYAYSLINNGVRFSCINQVGSKKKVLLSTDGNKNVPSIISGIFGETQTKQLLKIEQISKFDNSVLEEYNLPTSFVIQFDGHFTLNGFISAADHGSGRNLPDRQFIFINNRPCDFTKLLRLINEVYHTYNRHQYPFIYLNILARKDCVDVNITPNKRQIMVQEEKVLLAFVKSTLKYMFENLVNHFKDNATFKSSSEMSVFKLRNPQNEFHYVKNDKQSVFSPLEQFRCKYDSSSTLEVEQTCQTVQTRHTTITNLFKKVSSMKRCQSNDQICDSESKKCKLSENSILDGSHLESVEEINSQNLKNIDEKYLVKNTALLSPCLSDNKCLSEEKFILQPIIYENGLFSNEIIKNEKCHDLILVTDTLNTLVNESVNADDILDISVIENKYIKKVDQDKIVATFDFSILKEYYQRHTFCEQNTSTLFHAKINPSDNSAAEEELTKHVSKDMFAKMEIIGQFNLGFIITKYEENLFIIDQHATDEKYNFETLQKKHILKGQRLIEPISMELTLVNESILIDNINIFKKNGFEFKIDYEETGNSKIKLLTVPTSLNSSFSVSDVEELIFMLNDSPGVMCRPSRVRQMFASKACRSSVMVGTALDHFMMKRLVQHMGEIEHPWNCPHGRPTMRHLICLQRINYD
ncbi:mismatch repair endonuclease PMS2 [Hydra vulgaris]|uniref:Mismatch repair endonuclease PMS2 n=1 Tax=Hydra vulgaris TaxID=6087 RepID=A0ABM4CNT0_HYDVU